MKKERKMKDNLSIFFFFLFRLDFNFFKSKDKDLNSEENFMEFNVQKKIKKN